MKLIFAVFAALAVAKTRSEPNIWAVLVAGSNEYYNYRHQVCFMTSLHCGSHSCDATAGRQTGNTAGRNTEFFSCSWGKKGGADAC